MRRSAREYICTGLGVTVLVAALALPAPAQDAQSLVREAKNPLANLINVQFIYDALLNVGPDKNVQDTLTIQPVIPFALDANWSVITRTVLPLISQPAPVPGGSATDGVGDTQFAAFLSPARTGKMVWGVGPVFQIPSASNDALGQGKWALGPAAAAQWSGDTWTFGALLNNIWSFAGGSGRPAVNQMQLQPEINYTFKGNANRYLSFSPTITANWEASGSNRWTVPVSLGLGQLIKVGKQSLNLQATAYYNVVAPPGAGNWTLELLVQLLFPQ